MVYVLQNTYTEFGHFTLFCRGQLRYVPNARAESLYFSLNLLFSDVLVAVVICFKIEATRCNISSLCDISEEFLLLLLLISFVSLTSPPPTMTTSTGETAVTSYTRKLFLEIMALDGRFKRSFKMKEI